jgi:endogenous inhibitor of DNA gyrase (YacG/DUF329 family)
LQCSAAIIKSNHKRQMRCPTCKRPVEVSETNRFRPFCSERCQMIDLGTWVEERYTVPGAAVDDHEHPEDRMQPNGRERKKLPH